MRTLMAGLVGAGILTCVLLVGSPRFRGSADIVTVESKDEIATSLFRDKSLVTFGQWTTSENPEIDLSYLVTTFEQDSHYKGRGVRLSIFNRAGMTVYNGYFTNISRIYPENVLRNYELPQLVVEVNFGGNADFLQVLAYRNGKVHNLADQIDFFSSHAEVRPQFRSAVHPAIEPYQILLTNPGLGGNGEKHTTVYRWQRDSYKPAGQFSQTKVDDLIERLLSSEQ